MLLFLLACAEKPADTGDTDDTADTGPAACTGADTPGTVTPFASGFASGTEGVSFSGGRLYVSAPDALYELDSAGAATVRATWDHALGLAPAAGGLLVADPGEFTFDGSGDDGRLRYVGVDGGDPVDRAVGMPNPNFVTATPGGEVLVSDDTGESVYAVGADGSVRTWTTGVPSPNGMAFAADGRTLYVVSTFAPEPKLWKIAVSEAGEAGAVEAVATFDTGDAPDGIAVDAAGGVWVALNLAGELVRVDPGTGETTDRVTGLATPASLAFGAGAAFDPCALYVTSLYGDEVVKVATAYEGLELTAAR